MESTIEQLRTILAVGWIGPLVIVISVGAIGYVVWHVFTSRYSRKLDAKREMFRPEIAHRLRPLGEPSEDKPPRKKSSAKPSSPQPIADFREEPDFSADAAPPDSWSFFDDPASAPLEDAPSDEITAQPAPKTTAAAPAKVAAKRPTSSDYDVRRVFFGTDRKAGTMTRDMINFGHERSGELSIGIAHITVPRKRPWGTIPRPRQIPFVGITIEKEKAAKHFTISDCKIVDPVTFLNVASGEARAATRFANSAFIFVHGFNVQFDAALFRCAQMAEDIGFDGPAFLYSWPAIGGGIKGTINYVTDIESADQAATHLDEFVDLILKTQGVERVHMITHSMGNKLLAEWFDKANTKVQGRNTKTIDQLILAAPDIDVKTFRDVSDYMQKFANGVTLYACATDLALIASKKLRNDYPRAGDVPEGQGPVVVEGIDTIDISAVGNRISSLRKYLGDDSFLDHSLFAEDREVLTDLGNLMRSGTRPPDARTVTYKKTTKAGADHWVLPR